MADAERQPEQSAGTPTSAKKATRSPIVGLVSLGCAGLVFLFVIPIGLGFLGFKSLLTETIPLFNAGQTGSVSCADWSDSPVGYQDMFTKAANAYRIQPALVGAMYLAENTGDGQAWPHDRPPFATSSAGAKGPFQFMDATWQSNGVSVDETGVPCRGRNCPAPDANDIGDASFGAARYMQAILSNTITKNFGTSDLTEIKLVGCGYNWGDTKAKIAACRKFLEGDTTASVPDETKKHMEKIGVAFQNLNQGCQSQNNLGQTTDFTNFSADTSSVVGQFTSIRQAIDVAGGNQTRIELQLKNTTFMGKPVRVHSYIVNPLKNVERDIKRSGTTYNFGSVGGFWWRGNANDPSSLSAHAAGFAVDINPLENPNTQRPASSAPRDPAACTHDIPTQVSSAFEKNGFFWGAKFRSICDAMHFQYGGNY